MQRDLLVAHEVVARGQARGDGDVDRGEAVGRPGRVLLAGVESRFHDLEPHGVGRVPGVDVLAFGDLGEVGLCGAGKKG